MRNGNMTHCMRKCMRLKCTRQCMSKCMKLSWLLEKALLLIVSQGERQHDAYSSEPAWPTVC